METDNNDIADKNVACCLVIATLRHHTLCDPLHNLSNGSSDVSVRMSQSLH